MGSAVEVTAVNSLKGEDVTEPPYVHSLMAPAALCKIDPVSQVSLPHGKGTSVASSAVDSLTHERSHLEFQSVAPSAADVASQLSHVDLDSQVSVSSVDPGRLVSLPQGKGTSVAPSAVDSLTHEGLHLRSSSVAPSAADVASQLSHVDLDSQVSEINYSPISTGNLPYVITPEGHSTISDSNSSIASNAEGVTNTRKAGLNTFALGASDGVKVGMKEEDSEVVPQHLEGLYRASIDGLDNEQTSKLRVLLTRYADVFASNDTDLGCFPGIKHKIDTGNAKPIRQPMRRTPMGFEQEERKHLESMLRNGVIQPSMSEWASPPVLFRKKDGGVRWCIDYRGLNNVTVKDAFPLPRIEECLDTLSETKFMTTLDLASGYWQLEIDEADRYKTAFITRYGLFEHIRMGFGLCNAPATFSRAMQAVLHGLLLDTVLAYLDDVIVLGDSFDSHLHNLAVVFERFREHNLKLKPSKCSLIKTQVKFLGKIVSDKGISIDPGNTSKVQDWPEPRSVNEVEIFLGFMNYHREYIKTYADIAAPLYQLTGSRGKTKEFKWGIEHQVAFDHLKLAMTTAPVLGYPKGSEPFILDTDASDRAIGAELSQLQDGKHRVIGYGSFVLTPAQRRYCTTRKELLALVRFTRQYRHYLLRKQFYVRTDHNSLVWLLRFRNVQGQLARWLEELSQYDMVVLHRPGVKHTNADSLSRIPDPVPFCNCYTAGMNYSDLPCGGCNYCQRAHQQWGRFENDVDDIVPLAVRQVLTAEPDDGPESEGNVLPPLLPKTPVTVSNWLPTYSCEELRSGQINDGHLAVLFKWIEEGYYPSQNELFIQSPRLNIFGYIKNN